MTATPRTTTAWWRLARAVASALPPLALGLAMTSLAAPASAQSQSAADKKPNILLIVSDDTGWGDLGPYLGGAARGMPTPSFDKLASEGMFFTNFYGQPSCTPGRAAIQTGRIPNRSGMTTVAFQGQGGGLPAAEWTLASVLKEAGYKTYFTGKWHLGEAEYALPNAQGYDVMKHAFLYHLNAYTYPDPKWFPEMDPELRAMFERVTTGSLSGNAGEKAKEDWKVNGEYVDTPDQGVVGIPFLDAYVEKAGVEFLEDAAKDPNTPFFININFMKNHQPNLPAPEFEHEVDLEIEIRRTRSSSWTRASAGCSTSWTSWASPTTRSSSTPSTTAPGRTSIPMPATRRSAAPRARCARAAAASPRWCAGRAT